MTSKPSEIGRQIVQRSLLRGRFVLRSGQVSDQYFDKYRFESDPDLLRAITEMARGLVPDDTEVLAGLELGGIPIVTLLSQMTRIPAAFIRKKAKRYGTRQLAEGADVSGRKVLIVEDVVTSGGQIIDSARALRSIGGVVDSALCVIDRESGGRDNLAAQDLRLISLFQQSDLAFD